MQRESPDTRQSYNSLDLPTHIQEPSQVPEPEKSRFRKKVALKVAALIVMAGLAVMAARLLGGSWQKILTVTIVSSLIFVLGALGAIYKNFGEWIEKGYARAFSAYVRFLAWMVVAFLPMTIVLKLNERIVKLPRTFQVTIFIVWGALLAYAIWLVATERRRVILFRGLEQKIGRFTPLAYSFNLLMIAMIFFSSVTYLAAHEKIRMIQPAGSSVSVESLQNFYLWHFLEALPLLKVNETVGWKNPLSYESAFVGWILLLFKLAVIVPVIACFASYCRNLGGPNVTPLTARRLPRRARCGGRRTQRAGESIYYRHTVRGYGRSSR